MAGFAGDPGSGCSCKRLGSKALSVGKLPTFSRLPRPWIRAGGAWKVRSCSGCRVGPLRRTPPSGSLQDFPRRARATGLPSQLSVLALGCWLCQHFPRASASASGQVAGSSLISEPPVAAPGPEHRERAWGSGPTSPSTWGSRECWKRGFLLF